MSSVLVGYIKIAPSISIDTCISELLQCAKKEGIGIWFNSDVHYEDTVEEYREKKGYLIFSITDSLKYENIHRLLLSDLCREGQAGSSKQDVAKISAILRIMLCYADKINLFLGNYNCFLYEYKTKINVSIEDFGKVLFDFIKDDDIQLKHFIIGKDR